MRNLLKLKLASVVLIANAMFTLGYANPQATEATACPDRQVCAYQCMNLAALCSFVAPSGCTFVSAECSGSPCVPAGALYATCHYQ